mgnify:CR=1 FL=1
MRICILKESLVIGGNERSAANMSKILSENNDVYIVLFDAKNIKYTYGGELYDLAIPPKKTMIGKIYNSFLRSISLKKFLREKQIDIIYMFTRIGNYQTQKKLKNVIKIISARDCASIENNHYSYNKALKKSDAMICNSEYIRNFYLSIYPENKDKIFSVYNIIDAEEIIRQSTDEVETEFVDFIKKHHKTISVVGRFCKAKGFEYLLEAFAKASNYIDLGLIMVGDGNYKKKYEEIIKNHKIEDRVYFTGFQKNPYKYMKNSNIFVLSSLSEGFPNVLAEAMSLGLPVIATNCHSGPAEILRDDCNYDAVTDKFIECDYGILTPRITETDNQNAIEELSKAMIYFANNEKLLEKFSALSRRRAKEYSPCIVGEKIKEILEILSERERK